MSAHELVTYSYVAATPEGKRKRGQVKASSQEAAAQRVQALGLVPVSVRRGVSFAQSDVHIPGVTDQTKLKPLAVATKQFAVLVRSGVTILQALDVVADQTDDKRLKEAFTGARQEVDNGSNLADALEKQEGVFPRLMLAIIRIGESGGFLDIALESAASNIAAELRLKQKVVSAMTYPLIVLAFTIIVAIAMIVFVVPVFRNMFANFGADLPGPTQLLVVLSDSSIIWAPLLIVLIIAGVLWWRKNKEREEVRKVFDSTVLKIPVFGPLVQKIALARFTRNLGTMLRSGVQLLQAVSITGEVSNNWVIEEALREAERPIRFGQSLADQLKRFPVFPPMVTQMVAVGEASGSLDAMLDQVATFYDDEVEDTTSKLSSIIEPLLIVFVGLVVGGMVIALYLPIFSMSSVITGGG